MTDLEKINYTKLEEYLELQTKEPSPTIAHQ